jgi:hypothetical protein
VVVLLLFLSDAKALVLTYRYAHCVQLAPIRHKLPTASFIGVILGESSTDSVLQSHPEKQ